MAGRMVRLFIVFSILNTLSAASDLSPKYVRLFTDSSGAGVWQMVGVAGFYNNIYGVEYQEDGNGSTEYTSFYCEEKTSDSIIRTRDGSSDPFNDMNGTYWLFSIKVTENIDHLSPLVVDIASSTIDCAGVNLHSSNGSTTPPINTLVYEEENSVNSFVKFTHPENVNPSIVFSLDYNSSKIYEVNLKNTPDSLILDLDLMPSDDEARIESMSVAKQPIDEMVDLYLNDNPGFGGDDNYSNYLRDSREYHSSNHQVPVDESNFISDNSELKIFSYDNSRNLWLEYNSKNSVATNEFSELQAGRGYWIKYDFNGPANSYIQTLDLNSSCGIGCESNLTIKAPSGNEREYDFPNSDIKSILTILDETNISNDEVNISAVKIADNSILIVAHSASKPTLRETTTSGKDVFLNIKTGDTSFSNVQDIKSGLVLGDSSVVLTSNSVYSTIAQKGWNLLTLPTSTIRKSVTGLIVDWNSSNGFSNFYISDEFGVNKVTVNDSLQTVSDKGAAKSAKIINGEIAKAQISGDLSSQYFNVRAIPFDGNSSILFVSNDKFIIGTTGVLGKVTNLTGSAYDLKNKPIISDDKKTSFSNYGQYAMAIQPNINSQFVKDGVAKIEINGVVVNIPSSISSILTNINALTSTTGVYAKALDHDMNGAINSDGSDYILLTSEKPISVKDRTYTKIYKFTRNSQGTSYINLYNGTDPIAGELKSIPVLKDRNISYNQPQAFKVSLQDDNGNPISTYSYILDENGSSIDGNESEYILVVSTDSSDILLREVVSERNMTKDALKEVFVYESNISSKGALLSGIQVNELSKYPVDILGNIDFSSGSISNITANPFITDDLLSSNSLITLSKAFSDTERYMPTMIIGSESDANSDRIYWKTLSPIQKVSRWYSEYTLFSTNNQKAYWVYLDDYPEDNPIQILNGDAVEEDEQPSVTKKYVRSFDNELNTTNNYFNLTNIRANVKGVAQNSDGTADDSSVYVVANLIGIPEIENLDFKMPMASSFDNVAPLVDGTMEFSTSINYFDVEGINNNLTSIKITATDGRLYTDEYLLNVDVQKPTKPIVSFKQNTLSTPESTTMYIISGDKGKTTDDTIKYLIFKDRVDDINGTAFDENENTPSNFVMSVDKSTGETGVDALCQSPTFVSDNLEYASLVIVALDDNTTSQANFSNLTKVNFVPMQNVHVLVNDATDTDKDQQPNVYSDNCEPTGGLVDANNNSKDSGVNLRSYSGEVTLAYKPFDVTTTTTVPLSMFVAIPSGSNNILVAKITYVKRYEGKNFFIHKDGILYKGTFLDEVTSGNYDDSTSPYLLTKISSSGQKIGE
jgi:hypothetical protein